GGGSECSPRAGVKVIRSGTTLGVGPGYTEPPGERDIRQEIGSWLKVYSLWKFFFRTINLSKGFITSLKIGGLPAHR
ncbi:hypothetical protein chiPu_0028741, partial [Chiloscyllium punctatum]|nr:hypothetical protein [Chiloscyllium punctatum]